MNETTCELKESFKKLCTRKHKKKQNQPELSSVMPKSNRKKQNVSHREQIEPTLRSAVQQQSLTRPDRKLGCPRNTGSTRAQ
jgi:hypothetical protein